MPYTSLLVTSSSSLAFGGAFTCVAAAGIGNQGVAGE